MDDIVTRLQEQLDGAIPMVIERQDVRDALDEIERLREELKSQTLWAELLSGENCHCVAEDADVCMPCAYRQTIRQNEEARRG